MITCPRCGGQLFNEKIEKNTLDTVCLWCGYRQIKIFYEINRKKQIAMKWSKVPSMVMR